MWIRSEHRRSAGARVLALAAVAAIAAGVAEGLDALGAFSALERSTIDARFTVRGSQRSENGIVIVALDARSLEWLGRRPPLPRVVYGRLIDALHAAHARLIVIDLQFIGATDASDDRELARAISLARPVVLATHDIASGPLPVPGGGPSATALGALPASAAVLTDPDGVVRRMMYAPVALPTVPVRAASVILGHPVSQAEFPGNAAWIDYRGPPGTFRAYSLVDVLRGRVPAAQLTGRIVLVGATDPIFKDVFPTPTSADPMAGVEILANSLATILAGFPLTATGMPLTLALILLLAILPALTGVRFTAPGVTAVAALTATAFALAAQLAFDSGLILTVTAPLAALAVATVGTVAVEVGLETRERRALRAAFSRFVPAPLVDELVQQAGEDRRLPGRRSEATVLFCDLRGFTTFSEARDPEPVLDVAHQYLSEMSAAILDHGGTLVAFMGDGLMALFGAPVNQPDHADRALDAAREILGERLPAFNRWLSKHALDGPFRLGIGLHSGPVMSGSVGSRRRMEYTAIGDTVNTAARIQEMTKTAGHQLLLSGSTRAALTRASTELEDAGEHPVRGRGAPIHLYALPGSGAES